MKKRSRIVTFLGVLALAAVFPAPEKVQQADMPAEVAVNTPPLVALTFDDGPRSATTGPLLDGLELREVPATFFLVGNRIPGNEDLVLRMKQEGHQIGIHTYDHTSLKGMSRQDFDLQVGKTRDLLTGLLGEGAYWLRPPYGQIDQKALDWCTGPVVLWSVDPEDWKDSNVERIVAAVVDHVSDGDIILMHDLFSSSEQAALQVVDALLEKGYCFVTVEQLMEERGVVPEAGVRYRKVAGEKTD